MPIQKTIGFALEIREVPPAPDFFPTIDPVSGTVLRGSVAAFAISFSAVGGFVNPIALAVLGLPAGAVATFGVNPALPTDVVSLTIETATAEAGMYGLLVEATEVVGEPGAVAVRGKPTAVK